MLITSLNLDWAAVSRSLELAVFDVARAFADHTDKPHDGSTYTYVRTTITDVAHALATLANEPHTN